MKNQIATAGRSGAPSEGGPDGVRHEYLTFTLGREEYGIPILNVQEIIGYQEATPIPNSPAWVKGVVNIRGVVIPVVDIREKFTMPATEYNAYSVIIVNRVGERVIGAVVDAVNDVLAFTDAQIQEAPQVSRRLRTDFITGLGKLEGRLVLLLDMEQLLGDEVETVEDTMAA